ncbi:MAG: hypothetical protein ACK5N0_00780 [Synechococcaceae cyanobacterium]
MACPLRGIDADNDPVVGPPADCVDVDSYQWLVSLGAAQVLGELYGALRLITNLFQHSFKLKSSERDDGRIKRKQHPPRTPHQRLLTTAR